MDQVINFNELATSWLISFANNLSLTHIASHRKPNCTLVAAPSLHRKLGAARRRFHLLSDDKFLLLFRR